MIEKEQRNAKEYVKSYETMNKKIEDIISAFEYILGFQMELVIVIDKNTGEILYTNKNDEIVEKDMKCIFSESFLTNLINETKHNKSGKSEIICKERGKAFSVRYFPMEWHGRDAILNYFMEITHTKRRENQLKRLATIDPMTETLNVRGYRLEIAEILKSQQPLSVVMIDLDNLKYINDTWGHNAGDEFILKTLEKIKKHIRQDDFIVRYGGDEFVLIMPNCFAELATEKMMKAREELQEENKEKNMSFSYGVRYVTMPTVKKVKEAVKEADADMYRMKKIYKEHLKKENSKISNEKQHSEHMVAYVDGSYEKETHRFSYGVVIIDDENELYFSKMMDDPELVDMRNVAGEIKGAEVAMNYAFKNGVKNLTLYHDYEGIAKWCTGQWQAKKIGTQRYRDFYRQISKSLNIEFVKVKSHSGDKYNDMADKLAKEAFKK